MHLLWQVGGDWQVVGSWRFRGEGNRRSGETVVRSFRDQESLGRAG